MRNNAEFVNEVSTAFIETTMELLGRQGMADHESAQIGIEIANQIIDRLSKKCN